MKTYKHNNNELISEECLAILHKNAKNIRIKKAEERKKQKIKNVIQTIFVSICSVSFVTFMMLACAIIETL